MLKQIQCLTTFVSCTIWMLLEGDRLTALGINSLCSSSVVVQLPSTAFKEYEYLCKPENVSLQICSIWASLLRQPRKMLINPKSGGGWKHHAVIWPFKKKSHFHSLSWCKISSDATNKSNREKDTVHGRVSLPWVGYFQDIPHPSS